MNPPSRLVRVMTVLWPAFGVAALMEAMVFAFVDPHDLRWAGELLEVDRAAVYTLAFLLFWAATSAAGAITLMLADSFRGKGSRVL